MHTRSNSNHSITSTNPLINDHVPHSTPNINTSTCSQTHRTTSWGRGHPFPSHTHRLTHNTEPFNNTSCIHHHHNPQPQAPSQTPPPTPHSHSFHFTAQSHSSCTQTNISHQSPPSHQKKKNNRTTKQTHPHGQKSTFTQPHQRWRVTMVHQPRNIKSQIPHQHTTYSTEAESKTSKSASRPSKSMTCKSDRAHSSLHSHHHHHFPRKHSPSSTPTNPIPTPITQHPHPPPPLLWQFTGHKQQTIKSIKKHRSHKTSRTPSEAQKAEFTSQGTNQPPNHFQHHLTSQLSTELLPLTKHQLHQSTTTHTPPHHPSTNSIIITSSQITNFQSSHPPSHPHTTPSITWSSITQIQQWSQTHTSRECITAQ